MNAFSRPLAYGILFVLGALYHGTVRHIGISQAIWLALVEAGLLLLVFQVIFSRQLARNSLLFLASPYLLFLGFWLNLPVALFSTAVFLFCLYRTLKDNNDHSASDTGLPEFLAFLLMIFFVNLSGIGGYGFQSPDHAMHNSRLNDLIHYSWPVQYEANKHLVYYIGYFLPAAAIGKLSSFGTATHFLYFFALLGFGLSLRWFSVLSGWRLCWSLVPLFMLFGSLDVLNALAIHFHRGDPLWAAVFPLEIGRFEFITGYEFGFFLGNYLSNTLQFYFSPHQVMAGWIGMGLISHLYITQKNKQLFFIFALLALWSPFIMFGLLLMVATAALPELFKKPQNVLTIENTMGAAGLLAILMIYYLGGSAGKNPFFMAWTAIAFNAKNIGLLLLFWFAGWGAFALLITPYMSRQIKREKIWFIALLASLFTLSLFVFGSYSDLFCRGNAPLMFLLMAFTCRAMAFYFSSGQPIKGSALILAVMISSLSSLQQHAKAIYYYGEVQPSTTVIHRKYAWENFGPDDSIFGKYLRKEKPLSSP